MINEQSSKFKENLGRTSVQILNEIRSNTFDLHVAVILSSRENWKNGQFPLLIGHTF